jgi:hypothetical protein
MRNVTLAVTFSVAATLGAMNAQAQPPIAPTIYCIPGSGGSCFAAAWQYTSSNMFSLWMQNLQGSYGGGGTPGFDIKRVVAARNDEFALNLINLCSSPFQGAEGNVQGNPLGFTGCFFNALSSTDPWQQVDFPLHFALYVSEVGSIHTGIAGCDPVGSFLVATCPRDGLDGWWRIDFQTNLSTSRGESRPSTINDFGLAIAGCNMFIGANSGVSLATREMGMLCETTPYSALIPEPSTVALFGTGLLGLVGVAVGRRRRRAS